MYNFDCVLICVVKKKNESKLLGFSSLKMSVTIFIIILL